MSLGPFAPTPARSVDELKVRPPIGQHLIGARAPRFAHLMKRVRRDVRGEDELVGPDG